VVIHIDLAPFYTKKYIYTGIILKRHNFIKCYWFFTLKIIPVSLSKLKLVT